MLQRFGRRTRWLTAASLVLALAIPVALAKSPAYPSKAKVYGVKTWDWVSAWWQWSYTIPLSHHPLFDEDGTYASVGQRGPVWFLGGVFNESGTVTRTITVPAGTVFFFPLLSVQWDNVGQNPGLTLDQLKDRAAQFAEAVDTGSLFCEVDGVSVPKLHKNRLPSKKPFSYTVPPDSLPIQFGAEEGEVVPFAVSDGYWVMLRALPPGNHVLRFGGTVGGVYDFSLDITYNVTVLP